MRLYYSPGACSLAPHIVLREVSAPFELVKVDTRTHTLQGGEDYYAINPKGYVPLLELDDGQRLTEGPVICQYLADQAGRTDLMPAAGSMARYRTTEWQNYITAELHKSYSPLFNAEFDESAKGLFLKQLRKKFGWVSEKLAGKDFLTGSVFTAADAYLFVLTNWSGYVKLDLTDLAPLQAFMQRVAARPAVQAAFKAEGLAK